MALYLQLTVRFFSDRYHGAGWPPSPARVFQALVAGGKTGAPLRDWIDAHANALRWLESVDPPEILARAGYAGHRYRLFVPNNNYDRVAQSEAKKSKTRVKAEGLRTQKLVAPTILGNHTPGEPDVIYRWHVRDANAARAHLPALDQLAARLRALGWGVDFAAAIATLDENLSAPDGLEPFAPGVRGDLPLSVPVPGLFDDLEGSYNAFVSRISKDGVNPYTRPTRFGEARYRHALSWQRRDHIVFGLQILEGQRFARWDQVHTVATWVRQAVAEAFEQEELDKSWIDSFALGHTSKADMGHRLSFVPLPSVGHQHSDGGVRRVMIVQPPSAGSSDAEAFRLLAVKLSGWVLTEDNSGTPRAVLVPLESEHVVVPFYNRTARIWQTVTPVILHGYNSAHGRISLAKTDRLLCQAFHAAGFSEPLIDNITFQRAPYWAGSEASTAIRVPPHLAQWPRLHVCVEFKQPIQGPVLAGIGRHYGIGVFAAPVEE